MSLQHQEIKHKQGETCPACASSDAIKTKGMLITKRGRFGIFLGCSRYPDCKYATNATRSDKRKHEGKKVRRGKKKKPNNDPLWRKKVEEAMIAHKQSKERGQMFRDFERLISY